MAKDEKIQLWQELRYPTEDAFIKVMVEYPELEGRSYYELPAFLRLGWPEDLWNRVARTEERERWKVQDEKSRGREPQPWPVARRPWAEVVKTYPMREEVSDDDQDFMRMLRYWPDSFGQPIVEIELILRAGITINSLTYGPGKHRVPSSLAADLRYIDGKARQDFIDQFIPKRHQDKVLATLSMTGQAGGDGEVRE